MGVFCADWSKEYSQLKNTVSLSWGRPEEIKSLAYDFLCQKQINDEQNIVTKNIVLVTSKSDIACKMEKRMPTDIESFSRVFNFLPVNTSQSLENTEHCENLKVICPFDEIDKLEAVHASILGAWVNLDKSCHVSELIERARTHNPCYIRSESNLTLDPRCKNLLDAIPSFIYGLEDGFLRWSYNEGVEKGVFGGNNSSEKFSKFQAWVIKTKPKTFEDIEGALL